MSVLQQFVKDEIVKDVIDVAPGLLLKVTYSSGLSVGGTELTPTQVQDQPKVEWIGEKGSFYTLLLTDPDAPSRADPKWKEVRHWLVANIPGRDLGAGETLIEYLGSAPVIDSGIHRYVFLLFKQTKGKQDFNHPRIAKFVVEGRLSKSTRQLISDHNLELVAGNFYFAQYDDFVPSLHAQFV